MRWGSGVEDLAVPRLDKDEREEKDRKGAGVPLWAGSRGAAPGGWGAGGGWESGCRIALGQSVLRAPQAGFWSFFLSNPARLAGVGAVAGVSLALFGWGFLWQNKEDDALRHPVAFSAELKDSLAPEGRTDRDDSVQLLAHAYDSEKAYAARREEQEERVDWAEVLQEEPEEEFEDAPIEDGAGAGEETGRTRKAPPQVGQLQRKDFFGSKSPTFASGATMGPMMMEFQKPMEGKYFHGARSTKGIGKARRKIPASKLSLRHGKSKRAMGQLKLAHKLSNAGMQAPDAAAARTYAADAFDQRRTLGDTGGPIGSGMGDGASEGGITEGPLNGVTDNKSVAPANATPYQDQVDKSKEESDEALILMIVGGVLLAMGGLLAMIGKKLMADPLTLKQGKALLALGVAMMVAGAGMLVAGYVLSQQAKDRGRDVSQQSGQADQGRIMQDKADAAANKQDYTPSFQQPGSSVQRDVARERSATYSMD